MFSIGQQTPDCCVWDKGRGDRLPLSFMNFLLLLTAVKGNLLKLGLVVAQFESDPQA